MTEIARPPCATELTRQPSRAKSYHYRLINLTTNIYNAGSVSRISCNNNKLVSILALVQMYRIPSILPCKTKPNAICREDNFPDSSVTPKMTYNFVHHTHHGRFIDLTISFDVFLQRTLCVCDFKNWNSNLFPSMIKRRLR